jgi:RNA polymerase sigma-32 factor
VSRAAQTKLDRALPDVRPSRIIGSVHSIDAYKSAVLRIPMVTADEHAGLSEGLKAGSRSAINRLVTSHLRLVASIARTQFSTLVPESDLIQEGSLGLMKAAEGFDPDRGAVFATYALPYIKSHIAEYIIRNERIVRRVTTKAHRKLYFNLHRYLAGNLGLRADQVSTVCSDLGVTPCDVDDALLRLRSCDVPIHFPADQDDSDYGSGERLVAEGSDPAGIVQAQDAAVKHGAALTAALNSLDVRSRRIVTARWLSDPDDRRVTHSVLANEFAVSIERIRQIEKQALLKMRLLIGELH